jgi:hypothetical protein
MSQTCAELKGMTIKKRKKKEEQKKNEDVEGGSYVVDILKNQSSSRRFQVRCEWIIEETSAEITRVCSPRCLSLMY